MNKLFRKNILIIGLGSIGERHVRNLLKIGAKNIYVVRRKNKKPRTIKKTDYSFISCIDDALKLDISAAIIATPTNKHTADLLKLVKSRIPVLVEVPLSNSLYDLNKINNISKKLKVPILIGHNLKFHPSLLKINQLVKGNKYGKTYFSRSQFGEYLPECHPWEDYKKRYEAKKSMGGGPILTSIHEIDHAVWLFGKVKTVTCVAKNLKLPIDVEDTAMIILEHQNKIVSEIQLDFIQRPYTRNIQITSDRGSIEWGLIENNLLVFSSKTKKWKKINNVKKYDINQTYIDELIHFSEIVLKNKKPLTSLDDGIHVLKVALGALKSSRLRKAINIL